MKKALIALSVAAGMIAAAQAENTTTLYGSLGVETQISKNGSIGNTLKGNRWNLDTSSAKFGIKGTEDLNNGLQAFYKMEFGFDVNGGVDRTRYAYLGLTGNFGTVTFGLQDSLYKVVTNKANIFENNFYGDNVHFGKATGGGRIPKVISYVSPNFNGFQFGVAGVLDGDDEVVSVSDSKAFSAYQVGAWYAQNGFYVGVAYSSLDTGRASSVDVNKGKDPTLGFVNAGDRSKSVDVVGLAAQYSNDQFLVAFSAEHKEGNDLLNAKSDRLAWADGQKYALAGEYYLGPNTFRAGFGVADLNREAKEKIYTYGLGYQYNFSKRTYTYVEGEYIDWNKQLNHDKNGYTVRVGLRHNF